MSTSESTHKTRAIDAAESFMRSVNEMSFDTAAFAEVVATDHRTLQQSAAAVLLSTIFRLADNSTDERNEFAVAVCKKVRDVLLSDGQLFTDSRGVVRFPFL